LADDYSEGAAGESESVEVDEKKSEDRTEEKNPVTRRYPANKYELAIVAAKEARRLNENWKDTEERRAGRVTELALDKAKKGEVHYSTPEGESS
jgi:DNA-directed RNA polymerase subunit K/omega